MQAGVSSIKRFEDLALAERRAVHRNVWSAGRCGNRFSFVPLARTAAVPSLALWFLVREDSVQFP